MNPFNKIIIVATWCATSLLLLCTSLNCSKQAFPSSPPKGKLSVSEPQASLTGEDHTSEGFLITMDDGRIVHFFRLDPGVEGGHVGNQGRIVKRVSADNGKTWGAPETVYNDQYDDRNIRGLLTDDGKLLLFFRRFEATEWKTVDLNYIVSTDGGETWSERRTLPFSSPVWEYQAGAPVALGGGHYLLPTYGVGYCEMRKFTVVGDSLTFTPGMWVFDHTQTQPLGIDEPYCAVLPEGKMICLFRDDRKAGGYTNEAPGANYYQSVSVDDGRTWTLPEKTNIADTLFCAHPLLLYEPALERPLVAVATDRRKPYQEDKVWVYSGAAETVFHDPKGWKLLSLIDRPQPLDYAFYGYPCATKTKDGRWLVVLTESAHDGINEDTDFYQFYLTIILINHDPI
jgi:hypothetical protein